MWAGVGRGRPLLSAYLTRARGLSPGLGVPTSTPVGFASLRGHKLVAWRDRTSDRQAVQRVAKYRGTCVGSM
jgi:hypothetical protein